MKKSCKVVACFSALFMLLSASFSCLSAPISRYEETRDMMDTYVQIIVYADEATAEEALDAAFDRIEEVVAIASRFDEDSEVSMLNRDGSIQNPSDEMLELIEMSIEYSELTEGYFDITVLPLLNLWSYDPTATVQFWELDSATQQAAIDDAKLLVGSDMITVSASEISFDLDGMGITLDAIAKGYAVDEAIKVIESLGVKYALVNAGGDINTLGSKPKGVPWAIPVVNPDDTSQSLAGFEIVNKAIATSGNYMRYLDDEASVGHILNPETGRSATGTISSTIIAQNGAKADALATAVFVMGPIDGMALVEALDGVEALIVDDDRVIHRSSGIPES